MYKYEIIKPEEVMNALVAGDEVYYLQTDLEVRNGIACKELTKMEFYRIENIIANAKNDKVFIRSKFVEVEGSEDEE